MGRTSAKYDTHAKIGKKIGNIDVQFSISSSWKKNSS
jgi:hypothetical protein